MKQEYILGILGIIALAVIWYFFFNSGPYDDFAQCLTNKEVKFYGTFWCPHCANQKALFGNSMKYVNYIECSNKDMTQTEVCKKANIQSYPTWEFANGTRLTGEVSMEQLSKMSGCPLTKT
ncbi:hypothetical protein HY988_01540 [Candidatus Micrarchaeota archaeon]|nr:hypothetical protein [Candidatus Micrarchaeota archaeon]